MTLDKLKEIFKHQTIETETYKPDGLLSYIIFDQNPKGPLVVTRNINEWELILEQVKGFEHDGYRDRTPLFVLPNTDL
jgi:hypothetical protein